MRSNPSLRSSAPNPANRPMSFLKRSFVLLGGLSAMVLAGCSGGSSSTAGANIPQPVRCPSGDAFCLISCDLGCTAIGCSITEVAENQRLHFTFNQALDPQSVNNGSVSIRTATGEEPAGLLSVEGRTVVFQPSISVSGGISSFGFRRGQAYIVTLVGGAFGVKSTSGSTLRTSFSCTIAATLGIQDADAAPPRAELIAPTNLTEAPLDSTIVVRFSEVVDTTSFLQPVSASTPIRYVLRRSRVVAGGTTRECNVDSEAIQLEGLPVVQLEFVNGRPVTTISLRPTLALPGLACVEVGVTSDVRDISGRGAEESTFRFITTAGSSTDTLLTETFANETRMDVDVSGGAWANGARPAQLGGDGRHGSFNPANGVDGGNGVFVWNTDSFTIPATQTFDGQIATVQDGQFYFTDFVVPAGTTVRFTGSQPARIYVRGKVEINGRVQVNGVDQTAFNCRNPVTTNPNNSTRGQVGSPGGPGGGRGGNGGDRCLGNGPNPPVVNPPLPADYNYNGRNGDDVRLTAGHAYAANVVGTGGRGAPMHPLHGLDASLVSPINTYTAGGVFNSNVGFGGSGGGFHSIGLVAANVPAVPNVNQTLPAAPVAGGIAFDPLPLPGASTSSLAHFLIGGAGGGGGGSHPFLGLSVNSTTFNADRWKAGGGGTGGGGAIAIRSGRDMVIGTTAVLESKGGAGAVYNGDNPATPAQDAVNVASGPHWGIPAPGGGGSGGSILLQASRDLSMTGLVDTSGGAGSRTDGILPNSSTASLDIDNRAGSGAPGYYRFESGRNLGVVTAASVPAYDPARNAAALRSVDRDPASGSRSLWRSTGFVFPPEWLRYEMEVDVDGDGVTDRLYTDDPTLAGGFGVANDPLGPVTVMFQGARVNSIGVPDPVTIRQWRFLVGDTLGVGINSDLPTGFRFQLIFNTALFPNAVVKRLTVVTRG